MFLYCKNILITNYIITNKKYFNDKKFYFVSQLLT